MSAPPAPKGILVTDFDGTLTRHDFYQLVLERLLPPGTPNFWDGYLSGETTHFETLGRYFSAIRAEEAVVLAMLDEMQLEPRLAELLDALKRRGWEVEVASAGCAWYINKLLTKAKVTLPVHASPGEWKGADGLLMSLPVDSPYYSPTHGIDKVGVVRAALGRTDLVAFAGDGFPDVPAALLVPPERRFARGDCAQELTERGERFRPFETWSEVADALLEEYR